MGEVNIAGPFATDPKGTSRKYVELKDSGTLVATGTQDYFLAPEKGIITSITGYSITAPTTADVIYDVNKNAVTMFTDQDDRPTIADGANVASETLPAIVDFDEGDIITIDCDQIGSGTAGANAVIVIGYEPV